MRVFAAFAVTLICLGALPVHAGKRVGRDASAIEAALGRLDFVTTKLINADAATMNEGLKRFVQRAAGAEVIDPIASGLASDQKRGFEAQGPLAEDKIVNIPAKSGVRDIAELLQSEGVIDKPWIFVAGALALKIQGRGDLKAGEYQFNKQASIREVVETLIEGKVVPHLVTVAEGLTSEQIVQRLMDSEILNGNVKEIPREGTLLPESYKINRGTPREQLLQRMQQAQRRALQEIWERRMPDLPIKTPKQLVNSRVHDRKGDRTAGRAHPHRRRVRQPAQAEDEAAVRSHHHLWARRRKGLARPSAHAQRDRAADALQHLCDRWPAA